MMFAYETLKPEMDYRRERLERAQELAAALARSRRRRRGGGRWPVIRRRRAA